MGLETIYKTVEKNKQRKYALIQAWSMNIQMKGKTLLKPDIEGLLTSQTQTRVPVIIHECLPIQHVGCCEKCQMVTAFTSIKETLLHSTFCQTS